MKRAIGSAARYRKRTRDSDSDSSDCDDDVSRQLNEIKVRNEEARTEVVSARNDYPVLFVNVNGLLITV